MFRYAIEALGGKQRDFLGTRKIISQKDFNGAFCSALLCKAARLTGSERNISHRASGLAGRPAVLNGARRVFHNSCGI
jgi:hypothetical protein